MSPFVGYVAYIDEAGDDGLKRVLPLDSGGATEWFAVGAIVVPLSVDPYIKTWANEAARAAGMRDGMDLHFAKMNDHKRRLVCSHLSTKNFRSFIAISHKPNIRGYRNDRAATVGTKNVMYNFMLRLLLERISHYVAYDARIRYQDCIPKINLIASRRGGMDYAETRGYLGRLWLQSQNGTLHIYQHDLNWSVIDVNLFRDEPHEALAGLQVADIAVSAFYKALSSPHSPGDPVFADLMRDRMASTNGKAFGTGIKLMPGHWRKCLTDHQQAIFTSFGALR